VGANRAAIKNPDKVHTPAKADIYSSIGTAQPTSSPESGIPTAGSLQLLPAIVMTATITVIAIIRIRATTLFLYL
jgi:hypothetical protein